MDSEQPAGQVPLSRAAIEALGEAMEDAAWIIAAGGELLFYNSAFSREVARLLSIDPWSGMTLDDLVPRKRTALHAFWSDLYMRALRGRAFSADGAVTASDGLQRRFIISARPFGAGPERGAAFVLRDISQQRRRHSHEFFELALTRIFAQDDGLDSSLCQVLEAFCESVGWDLGIGWLVDSKAETLEPRAIWMSEVISDEEVKGELSRVTFRRGHGVPGRVWQEGTAVWLPDLMDETNFPRALLVERVGLRAVVAFPLIDQEETIGVLEFFSLLERPAESDLVEVFDELGKVVGRFIGRRIAEEERSALHLAMERKTLEWTATFDAINTPILLLDLQCRIHRLNHAALELAGALPESDLLGKRVRDIADEEIWRIVDELAVSVRDARMAASFQLDDEPRSRHWELTASYCPAAEGEERIIVILVDVSRLFSLQDSLESAERFWAMGELVAGVAHEVRNPLFGISATLDALDITVEQDESSRELFAVLRQWIERLNDLMVQLLEYGKTWNFDLRDGAISEVVDLAVDTCRPLAERDGVELRVVHAPASITLLMESSRLVRVFQNLITNAIQHSSPGQVVDVFVREVSHGDGSRIECEVRDSGSGVPPDDLAHVFQPFFTRRRGGVGLGLSIVQRIVEEHGGTIRAENRPEGGASVRFSFPRMPRG